MMQSEVGDSYRSAVGDPLFEQMARRMGVPYLHDFQIQAITSTLKGQDSFLVVPTGSGKSLCYIIPSLLMPGLVLVISPLIALMRDQQRQLQELDIPSLSFDSLMSPEEKRDARQRLVNRDVKVLYISPERLALPGFRDFLKDLPIALIAIDEAHCVQQWGQGFRPEYLRLGAYIDELGPAPRMALTATVTSRERHDIIKSLRMREPAVIVKSALRDNLDLVIHRHGKVDEQKDRLIKSLREMGEDEQGIVYAATRKNVEEIFHRLRASKLPVSLYHGGMMGDERLRMQETFLSGKSRIMVATKAFGMGINLPSIRFVSHANMPCSIESYTQEVGRAGRDNRYARCDLHYGPRDYFLQKFMIEKGYPTADELTKVWGALQIFLSSRHSRREDDLVPAIIELSGLLFDVVRTTLDFLLREQAVQLIETFADEDSFIPETFASLGDGRITLNSLLQALQEQVAWKFDKLNAMHRLVKETDDPKDAIDSYFV